MTDLNERAAMNRIKHQIFVVWIGAWIDLFDSLVVILTLGFYRGFGFGLRFRVWCIKWQVANEIDQRSGYGNCGGRRDG